jgi:hypothetical protein
LQQQVQKQQKPGSEQTTKFQCVPQNQQQQQHHHPQKGDQSRNLANHSLQKKHRITKKQSGHENSLSLSLSLSLSPSLSFSLREYFFSLSISLSLSETRLVKGFLRPLLKRFSAIDFGNFLQQILEKQIMEFFVTEILG